MTNPYDSMKSLLDGILFIVKDAISKAPYNQTFTGIVELVNADGSYKVLLNGNSYDNIRALKSSITISINDTVKIEVPQNQMSNMYILGKLG